jgi:hypothetical protein
MRDVAAVGKVMPVILFELPRMWCQLSDINKAAVSLVTRVYTQNSVNYSSRLSPSSEFFFFSLSTRVRYRIQFIAALLFKRSLYQKAYIMVAGHSGRAV